MASARRIRKADTWKTKKWVNIVTPKMFGEVTIGETFSSDPSNLIGRTIETTMREIAGDFSKQHIQLRFKISEVTGDTANTKFVMHSLSRAYMRSQIRRKTTRVEGIQDIVTKDGYKLRVKTIALAAGRAQTAQEKLLRKLMNSIVKKYGSHTDFEGFIRETVLGKLPARVYRAANKVYPVRRVEIKKIKLLEEPGSKKLRRTFQQKVEVKTETKEVETPTPEIKKEKPKKIEETKEVKTETKQIETPKTEKTPEKTETKPETPEPTIKKTEIKKEKPKKIEETKEVKTEKKAETPKPKTPAKKKETKTKPKTTVKKEKKPEKTKTTKKKTKEKK